MDDLAILLKDLHDLQLPLAPSWWPPAIGWWLLLLLAVALYFVIRWFKHRSQTVSAVPPRELAFAGLKQAQVSFAQTNDLYQLAADLSVLLRQVAMTLASREEVASLTGTAWLQWLDQRAGKPLFEEGGGQLLADIHYRPQMPIAADAEVLIHVCREWLAAVFEETKSHA